MSNEPLLPTSHSRPSRLGARRISPQTSIGEATGSGASRGADQGLPLPNLSDKAKGKRRATFRDEDHTDIDSDSKADGGIKEEDRGRSVTFRFTGDEEYSTGDLDVWVDAGETVGRVKDKVINPNSEQGVCSCRVIDLMLHLCIRSDEIPPTFSSIASIEIHPFG
jgi:hypothetical protein